MAVARLSLVVLVIVDQLGADYLSRWGDQLHGGIAELIHHGAYYSNGVQAHANTETGPGHANIATGTWPSSHGIVANHWLDPAGREVYCTEDAKFGQSPANLMAPTLGDALGLATEGQSRTVTISLKDRAAILTAGARPWAAIWYDAKAGAFTTGSWTGSPAPGWLAEASAEFGPAKVFGRRWDPAFPKVDYARLAGDDGPEYERDVPGLGRAFPRTLGQGLSADAPAWLDSFRASPAGIDALFGLAQRAVEREQLGQRGTTDLLVVAISPLDWAGHWWGSHSREALDFLLRIDRGLGDLMTGVDRRVTQGKPQGSVLWALSADHGVAPPPEIAAREGPRSLRIPPDRIKKTIDAALAPLARKGQKPTAVFSIDPPLVFLDRADPGADRLALARAAAAALLAQHPDLVAEAEAAADVGAISLPYRALFARDVYAGRTPDVFVRFQPHVLVSGVTGSNHGSPYAYDTRVPIALLGPGVRPGADPRPVEVTRIVPSIAAILGILPPAAALDRPLPAVSRAHP